MSLLSKFFPKKDIKEYFLTLGVDEHHITAAAAVLAQNKVTILGYGDSEFRDSDEGAEAADIAISTAEKNVPENIFIEKVIFGLPVTFIENDKVKPEYLNRLKKITKALSLTPHGFIEYPQALVFYLENKEESPPTALLISLSKTKLTFSLVRVGKVEKNFIIPRTETFIDDFEKSLPHFKTDIMPSRIILYDETKVIQTEEIREELLRFSWHKHSSFIHTPKVEILPHDAIISALVETAGGTMLKDMHIISDEEEVTVPVVETEFPPDKNKIETSESFGFITQKEPEKNIEKQTTITEPEPQMVEQYYQKTENPTEMVEDDQADIPETENRTPMKLPSFHFGIPDLGALPAIAVGIIILLGFGGTALASVWIVPKATVDLIVYPVTSTQNIDVTFTSDSTKNNGKNIIMSNSLSDEVSGNKNITTTGKSKIGEAAKGEITIYNKTTGSRTFPKGTVLTNGSLKFSLDSDTQIASASETGEGLTFGKTTAKLTAINIGPEANLSSGSIFLFKDFPESSYYAKNPQNLSGGSSREISSVSKDDQTNLLNSLTQELILKAKQDLIGKLTSGDKMIDNTLKSTVVTKKFSKDIGAESKDLSLSLTLNVSVLSYKQNDLITLTRDASVNVPQGFIASPDRTQAQIDNTDVDKNGNVKAGVTVISYYIPQIETNNIRSKITGKKYSQAADEIGKIQNIGGIRIVSENAVPFLSNSLPFNTNNIDVKVTPR